MIENILTKYNVDYNPSDMPKSLEAVTKAYVDLVEATNSTREGLAQAETRVRNNWLETPELIKEATVLVDDFLPTLIQAMENKPELSAALYAVVSKHLLDQIKSERDGYVQEALKVSRKLPTIPVDDLDSLRTLIDATFELCSTFNTLPADYPTKVSKATGRKIPALPNKPQDKTRASVLGVIAKRFVWTIDSRVVEGSPRAIRKLLGVDTVKDIFNAFGVDGRANIGNGKVYTATINKFHVTVQVVGESTTPIDVEMFDNEEDTDNDN